LKIHCDDHSSPSAEGLFFVSPNLEK